ASALYKLNTGNKYDYTYGNKLSLNVQAYYKFRILQKFTLAPNAGVSMESGRKDADKGLSVDISGGTLSMGTLGAELSLRTFSFYRFSCPGTEICHQRPNHHGRRQRRHSCNGHP